MFMCNGLVGSCVSMLDEMAFLEEFMICNANSGAAGQRL